MISSAVKPDNPEVAAARARRLPVVRRAEMLAELMRLKRAIAIAGTHGKTTTTSMIGTLLETAGLDPTVINGGIINAYGTNTRLGAGDWMAVEADESDGTFTRLPATVAIVTNIDPEHLDFYGDVASLHQAFETFVSNIPFYGFAVLCIDHPVVQGMIPRVSDRRIVTYGFGAQADFRAANVRLGGDGSRFDAVIADRPGGRERRIPDLMLPMFGEHNVQNAMTVIAVADELGIADDIVREALRKFAGVRRRFTKTGEWNGVAIIDDYGHHPVEIAAVLKAARAVAAGRVIAVVQPHRYTRLPICSTGSAPVSTTPIWCWSPMSTRPARRRSKARRGTGWSPGCARTDIAARGRLPGRRSWRRWCAPRRGRATWSCASAPARSRIGRTRCPRSWPAEPRSASRDRAAPDTPSPPRGEGEGGGTEPASRAASSPAAGRVRSGRSCPVMALIDAAAGARAADGGCADRAVDLVPRRRAGGGAVPPGRRRGSWRLFWRRCRAMFRSR